MENFAEKNRISSVSIIIPCRNEEKFIGKCLDSIIVQDYAKDKIEVLVVDGMSDDGTRQVVDEYAKKNLFIKLLDNLRKITPCAFNLGIRNAKGKVIFIMGAHADYQKDYISKCVKYLYEYNADNVGGVMITKPQNNTLMGRAIAAALSSRFGVGNSVFRTGAREPKWVDTVFGGCYRKEVFEKIGLFNENLASSQDMEFNLRLKKSGGKILLVPDIISYYYARSDFKSFTRNNFRNGFWAVYPLKFVKIPFKIRHYVPFLFITSLIGTMLLGILWRPFFVLFILIVGLYLMTDLYFSAKISLQEKNWRYFFVLPFIFASLHLAYGFGSLKGLIGLLRRLNA